MTALEKYARLEGPGVWRATPDALRRNVVVTLGKATLMISDPRSGAALSHWSLAALTRQSRGTDPALYTPGDDDSDEMLEIDDLTLIEALETIRNAMVPPPPARWLRRGLAAASLLLLVGAALFLPSAIERHTAQIVPEAMRAQIGRDALDAIAVSPAGERVCAHPNGRQALVALRERVLGNQWRLQVVAGVPGFETTHLPGNLILIGSDLLERLPSAESLAGWILSEAESARSDDPLLHALEYSGLRATITLLTTGALPQGAMNGFARARMDGGRAPFAAPDVFRQRFGVIGVSPYDFGVSVRGIDDALSAALAPVEPTGTPPPPLLSDGDWLTLQAICLR